MQPLCILAALRQEGNKSGHNSTLFTLFLVFKKMHFRSRKHPIRKVWGKEFLAKQFLAYQSIPCSITAEQTAHLTRNRSAAHRPRDLALRSARGADDVWSSTRSHCPRWRDFHIFSSHCSHCVCFAVNSSMLRKCLGLFTVMKYMSVMFWDDVFVN